MTWPEGDRGRILATVYLIAFVAVAIGLVWSLYNQATAGDGPQLIAGFALFVVAQLTITALAAALPHHRSWHRLTLGLELLPAIRLLTTR